MIEEYLSIKVFILIHTSDIMQKRESSLGEDCRNFESGT